LVQNDLALMLTERFNATARSGARSDEKEASAEVPRYLPPAERTALIGRDEIETQIAELITRTDTACLTLTGPGGTGKTRLAVRAANALADRFVDRVFYVPLDAVRSGRDVLPGICAALELPAASAGASTEKLLVAFLRSRPSLLVLDNFEQVLDA